MIKFASHKHFVTKHFLSSVKYTSNPMLRQARQEQMQSWASMSDGGMTSTTNKYLIGKQSSYLLTNSSTKSIQFLDKSSVNLSTSV